MKFRSLGTAAAAAVLFMASGQAAADLDLARSAGCTACHAPDTKVVGPAWKDVAARYRDVEGARAMLISKVKVGGRGNWTDVTGGVPMPPYSPRVSDEDIERLIDFLLGL